MSIVLLLVVIHSFEKLTNRVSQTLTSKQQQAKQQQALHKLQVRIKDDKSKHAESDPTMAHG